MAARPRDPTSDPGRRRAWLREACTVAAYRDRWNIDEPTVVSRHAEPTSIEQLGHQRRAQAAEDRAVAITRYHRLRPRRRATLFGPSRSTGVQL